MKIRTEIEVWNNGNMKKNNHLFIMCNFHPKDNKEEKRRRLSGKMVILITLLGSIVVTLLFAVLVPQAHFFFLFLAFPFGPLIWNRFNRRN